MGEVGLRVPGLPRGGAGQGGVSEADEGPEEVGAYHVHIHEGNPVFVAST